MRRDIRLTERDLTRLVKRIVREEDEFDIEKTVMDAGEFDAEDIPEECKGNDPGMSKIEMLTGCIGSITKKYNVFNVGINGSNWPIDYG